MNKSPKLIRQFSSFIFLIFILSSFSSISQISTTVVKKIDEEQIIKKYDSLLNPPKFEDLEVLIGQVFYVKPVKEDGFPGRESSYRSFYSDEKLKNVYKKLKGSVLNYSEYESLAEKYFNVLDVKKGSRNTFIFKLEEIANGNIIYWEGENYYLEKTGSFVFQFPFVTVGFYEKLKERFVNQHYVIGNVSWRFWGDNTDINTGKKVDHAYGENEQWKCIDVTISKPNYEFSIVLENAKGEKLVVEYDRIAGNGEKFGYNHEYPDLRVFKKEQSNSYELKFGKKDWNDILQGSIWVGMTKQMCLLSRGKPDKINNTISNNSKFEQWVYKGEYIYFLDGKLSSIQD